MSDHKYKLKYDLPHVPGEFSPDEIKKEGMSGTDALIVFSLLYPEDGSFSALTMSVDGRNDGKELDDNELFKVWALQAKNLSESKTLSNPKKRFAEIVFEMFRDMIALNSGKPTVVR